MKINGLGSELKNKFANTSEKERDIHWNMIKLANKL